MSYVVIFRKRPACPCLAEWLPVYERELLRRGVIKFNIDIAQLIGGASASAGTHRTGGAADLWQDSAEAVAVAEEMGAAAWARTRAQGFDPHQHLVLNGCTHNSAARYQLVAREAGYNGLGAGGRGGRDPRGKKNLRTWKEGIAWAKSKQAPTFHPKVAEYYVDQAPAYGRSTYGLGSNAVRKEGPYPRGWKFKSRGYVVFEGVLYIQASNGRWFHGPSFNLVKPKPPAPPKSAPVLDIVTYNPSDKLGNDALRAVGVAAYLQTSGCSLAGMQEMTGTRDGGKASVWSLQVRSELDKLDDTWGAVIPTTPWNENYWFYDASVLELEERLDDLIIRVAGAEGKHASRAVFKHKATGQRILGYDTHLDPRNSAAGDRAREAQGKVIADDILATRKVVDDVDITVVVGDMNRGPSLTALVAIGLTSVRPRAKKKIRAEVASYQGSATTPRDGVPIDHIYTDADAVVDEYELMLHLDAAGRFPTPKPGDHQPVRARVTYPA